MSMSCQRLNWISSLSQVFAMKRVIDFCLSIRLVCTKDESFRRYHRPGVAPSSPSDSNLSPGTPFITVVAVSVDDYFAVVNCSTSVRVPHYRLDWYFKTSASLHSPRVIWQSGRSNTDRYTAYSPDQVRHYLQIKPVHQNDSGTYICLDQNTGSLHEVELIVRKFDRLRHNILRFQFTLEREREGTSILALLSLHQSSSAEQLNFEIAFLFERILSMICQKNRQRECLYRDSRGVKKMRRYRLPPPRASINPTKLTGILSCLVLGDSRSCAGCTIRLQMTVLVCLVLLSSILSRRTASESEVTWSLILCCIHIHYTCQCASSVHSHSCWIISNKEDLEGSMKSPTLISKLTHSPLTERNLECILLFNCSVTVSLFLQTEKYKFNVSPFF